MGSAPLPIEEAQITTGPGIRTWQFARSAARAGHRVILIGLRNEGAYLNPPTENIVHSTPHDDIDFYNLHYDAFVDEKSVREIVAGFKPDAIAGVSSLLPVATAAGLRDMAPVWADFFGDALSEIQAKAAVYPLPESDTELFHVWKLYRSVLARVDKVSVVSNPQRFSVIGQLAFCGRLNRHTVGYEFVHTIPCGIDAEVGENIPENAERIIRGKEVADDDFVVFWAGSYNTWSDVSTLVKGLEGAMAKNPRLKYVSIGGGTPHYNEKVFEDFSRLIEQSEYKERFILKGWVPNEQVEGFFAAADVGINVDRRIYEAEIGSRNRVLHFLAHRLPVVSTGLCEFVKDLIEKGHVCEFEQGKPASLTKVLLAIASLDRDSLKQRGESAREYVLEHYSFERTMQPFIQWLVAPPRYAPDNRARAEGEQVLNEIERFFLHPAQPTSSSFFKRLFGRITKPEEG